MAKHHKEAFDPGDPFDAMTDSFRVQVADMAIKAERAAIFRDLPQDQQLGCFVAGVLTGLMGVVYAYVREEHHKAVPEMIRDLVDRYGEYAAAIMDAAEARDD